MACIFKIVAGSVDDRRAIYFPSLCLDHELGGLRLSGEIVCSPGDVVHVRPTIHFDELWMS